MIVSSAWPARMFFGWSERVLVSNWSGGTGEKPMAVSSSKTPQEKISIGAGLCTIPRTYLATRSKSQSWATAPCRSRTNKNKIEHMKRPATKMPIAIRTPSSEKLIAPLSTSARKPTAVVSAPKKTARPSFATDVAMACWCGSPSARAWW